MIDKIYMTIFVVCFIVALSLTAYALYQKFLKKKKFIPAGTVMVRTKDGKIVPYVGKQGTLPVGILAQTVELSEPMVIDWVKVVDTSGKIWEMEKRNEK